MASTERRRSTRTIWTVVAPALIVLAALAASHQRAPLDVSGLATPPDLRVGRPPNRGVDSPTQATRAPSVQPAGTRPTEARLPRPEGGHAAKPGDTVETTSLPIAARAPSRYRVVDEDDVERTRAHSQLEALAEIDRLIGLSDDEMARIAAVLATPQRVAIGNPAEGDSAPEAGGDGISEALGPERAAEYETAMQEEQERLLDTAAAGEVTRMAEALGLREEQQREVLPLIRDYFAGLADPDIGEETTRDPNTRSGSAAVRHSIREDRRRAKAEVDGLLDRLSDVLDQDQAARARRLLTRRG